MFTGNIKTNVYLMLIMVGSRVFCALNTQAQAATGNWSNPAMIAGSNFGKLFQAYYLIGNYDMLIKLTATESRKFYGDQEILEYYSAMQFAFPIRLMASQLQGLYWTLNYKTTILATTSLMQMKVIVENDTCRLVLPNKFNQHKYFLHQWK